MSALFIRAALAFLALPGIVAFVVPLLMGTGYPFAHRVGVIPVVAGVLMLFWCVREFYVAGRGTLAPWSPPTALVVTGPYHVSRNPMYVAVLLILCGWAIGFGLLSLWIYAVAVAIAFHLRVVLSEEPFLARRHANEWRAYRRAVRRWVGRRGAVSV
jgi:protein-S-isoprenylcysteine O-methyltransferase Ste14